MLYLVLIELELEPVSTICSGVLCVNVVVKAVGSYAAIETEGLKGQIPINIHATSCFPQVLQWKATFDMYFQYLLAS